MNTATGLQTKIVKTTTDEPNVSQRTIRYDVYVEGKYDTTFVDIIEALDYVESLY